MNLKQGALLKNGEYRIEMMLGQGGFGITYLGVQVALGRKVAIKEFFMKGVCERDVNTSQVSISNADNKELASRFREKFLKEARSIASLEHPNTVPIIDVFECNGTAYYVMKHFSGASLADKVRGGALPESVAVRYIRQVAAVLDFVHSKRMMHLDVKPANILLDDNDNAVLIDFGLAKQYDTEGQQTSSTPVCISHGYAPIEQYKRGGVSTFSPATDIYSLGATLFKLVTGFTPPEASDVCDEGLPALPSDISPAVRGAIEAAMEPKRKDRPQSIAEFLAMLTENCGERVGESLLAHKTSVSSLGEAKTENCEAISDSKDPDTPTEDLIVPEEIEITAVSNVYVNEETRIAPKVIKDPKDSKDVSDPKAPEKSNTGKIVATIIAAVVLLGAVIGVVVGGSDEEEERIAREAAEQAIAEEQARLAREAEINAFKTRDFTVNGVSFKMVAVDGGTFQMGATSERKQAYSDEEPVHSVTLDNYYIGETEVMQELWQAVMGSNPSSFTGDSQSPVETISWNDCQTFVDKLNDLLAGQLPAGRRFRLPTEAEWEYAARGGKNSSKTQYSGSENLAEVAWYDEGGKLRSTHTHPVKKKAANELGLYDMSGNVWEWCEDYYDSDYYSNSPSANPQGPSSGYNRVLRGGSWYSDARNCHVATRGNNSPDGRYDYNGLRLAL